MRPRTLLALSAVALAAGGVRPVTDATRAEPTQRSAERAPLVLGMSFGRLGRFDPLTLERLPGRSARIGGHTFGWSFSSNRTKLVLGAQGRASRRQTSFAVFANLYLKRALVPVTTPLGPQVIVTVGLQSCAVPFTKNPGDFV